MKKLFGKKPYFNRNKATKWHAEGDYHK